MKYALGNMLNGAGGLNADKLSLDLQFAADKTLTARKGPTPVFTRASTATFVGSNGLIQSAAINAARFDHDPVTLACKGLLIEEQRQNLFVRSEEFSTSWVTTDATLSINAIISPDGNTTADKLIVNSGATNGRTAQTFALTGSHTMSVFAKAGEWSWVFLAPIGPGSGVWFNLSNGTIGTQSAGFTGAITSFGNGWYRCAVTCTGAGASTTSRIVSTNANSALSTGDGTSGIFIWGAQLEAGSFPTSYIPTTTASLARSADVCSITGSAFSGMWNSLGGTTFVSGDKTNSSNVTGSYFSHQSGATEVGPLMSRTSTILLGRIRNNSALDLTNLDASQSPAGEKKLAVAWKATSDQADRAYCSDGVILTNSNPNTGTAANNQTTLIIGSRPSTSIFNGTISSLRYYKKRLPNSKLQSLTA